MTKLVGEQRKTFLENLGRQFAGTTYYRDASDALNYAVSFGPYKVLELDFRKDYSDFYRGFQEVMELRILVMLTRRKAQADNSMILKELEGKGLTFLSERVRIEE
jgi:hypothetical protein